MKTKQYNPSQLEIDFADALEKIKPQLEEQLNGQKIMNVENKSQQDNPQLIFNLEDDDGDSHQMVVRLIQKPDRLT